jgi:hypothetical protein
MNLKNLTYRQKNKYILGAAFVFLVIAYVTAFSKTIGLYQKNQQLKAKIERAENAPQVVASLKNTLHSLNGKLDHYLTDTSKNHVNTLEVVSEFCLHRNLILKDLPRKTVVEEKDFTIETSEINVEGRFSDLLRLVYELEIKHKLGRLSSVSFKTYKDNQRKKVVLFLNIYIQNIKVNKPHETKA